MEGYRGHTGSNVQDFEGCCILHWNFLRDLVDSGSCRLFDVWFYGSWIWQIVLLWDPLDLVSCIRAMLWDPRDLGSCRAVLPSDPVDLGSRFLVTARVWRPCGWYKASRNSKLTFHQPHFASCLGKCIESSWTLQGSQPSISFSRRRWCKGLLQI